MTSSLLNRRVLITREASQARKFSEKIKNKKGIPIDIPLLKISCTKNDLDEKAIARSRWIFFTSAHGVRCFFSFYKHISYEHVRFATVGPKTEEELKRYGYRATFIPTTYNAETMAEEFLRSYPEATNILLVRGNISRRTLLDVFNEEKIAYSPLEVYKTEENTVHRSTLRQFFNEETVDFLTFTSPSMVRTFMSFMKDHPKLSEVLTIPCCCIGTTTKKEAEKHNFSSLIVPKSFTIDGMVKKMIAYK